MKHRCANCHNDFEIEGSASLFVCPVCNVWLDLFGPDARGWTRIADDDSFFRFKKRSRSVKKILCRLNGHLFASGILQTDRACGQVEFCARCGEYQMSMVVHDFKPIGSKSCIETMQCSRCRKQTTRQMAHEFVFEYVQDGSCVKRSTCRNCGRPGSEQITHSFGKWQRIGDDCKEQQVCSRCGQVETRACHDVDTSQAVTHDFGSSYEIVYTCKRCGKTWSYTADKGEMIQGNPVFED